MNLRKYQNEARYACNAMLNATRSPLFVSPTGTGKTRTAVAITADRISLKRRIYAVTPQVEIFKQWRDDYREVEINYGTINDKGMQGRNKSVYVCMDKSLSNIMQRLPESLWPDELIIDEAHHSAANTYEQIFDLFQVPKLGLTATPYRLDNQPLGKYYDDIIETIDMQTAIDNGYLAKPLVIVPEKYKIHVPIKGKDFDPVRQAELLGEPRIIGDMIEKYGLLFQGLPVLVACCTHEHAKQITEQFRDAGWMFEHIHSKLHPTDRGRMIRHIKQGKLNGLCTVGIGIEGLDIPGLFGLIWMRRTLSLTVYLQFTGRVLRSFSGKEYGIIIDGVGNTIIHGRPELTRKWSLDSDYIPQDESDTGPRMRICPNQNCRVANNINNESCHICGCVFADMQGMSRKFPTMVDGKLVVLEDEEMKHEISRKLAGQRKENFERMAEEETRNEAPPVELQRIEKVDIIRKGLLNTQTKFGEMARGWL